MSATPHATLNELKNASRTKHYADGHQKLLRTHAFVREVPAPRPSEHARMRKDGKSGPRPKSHKARRLARLLDRLHGEGWSTR